MLPVAEPSFDYALTSPTRNKFMDKENMVVPALAK